MFLALASGIYAQAGKTLERATASYYSESNHAMQGNFSFQYESPQHNFVTVGSMTTKLFDAFQKVTSSSYKDKYDFLDDLTAINYRMLNGAIVNLKNHAGDDLMFYRGPEMHPYYELIFK